MGRNDEFLRLLREATTCTLVARGSDITITGNSEEAQFIATVLGELLFLYQQGVELSSHDVRYALQLVRAGKKEKLHRMYAETVLVTSRGRQVKAKTLGQWSYIDSIKHNLITIAIGPAGTGKTYLAVALAVKALKNREVTRIVLTRPAVEAGEKLGFLPGDLQEKVDPYLRPLYDALYDTMGMEACQKAIAKRTIEIAPLAYMRGRTLNDAFIILDEGQNTTTEQMKMALTRFGFGAKMVVTGDVTQIDLPSGRQSGLVEVAQVLRGVEGVGIVRFGEEDVVRHEIVARVVRAYAKYQEAKEKKVEKK